MFARLPITGGMVRLSVHGSRTLTGAAVKTLILEAIDATGADVLVTHGEPEGVCAEARAIARELAKPLTLHFLNHAKRRGAWHHRSVAVLRDSDHALFVHDGRSRGTANELALAVKYGLPHTLHTIEPTGAPESDAAGLATWAI